MRKEQSLRIRYITPSVCSNSSLKLFIINNIKCSSPHPQGIVLEEVHYYTTNIAGVWQRILQLASCSALVTRVPTLIFSLVKGSCSLAPNDCGFVSYILYGGDTNIPLIPHWWSRTVSETEVQRSVMCRGCVTEWRRLSLCDGSLWGGGGSESGPGGAPLQVYGARQAAKLDRSCDPWATCRAVRVCDRYLHTTGREVLTADDSQRRTSSCSTTFLYGNTSCV